MRWHAFGISVLFWPFVCVGVIVFVCLLCLCVCVCVCVPACIYMCVREWVWISVAVYTWGCEYVHVCISVLVCVCISVGVCDCNDILLGGHRARLSTDILNAVTWYWIIYWNFNQILINLYIFYRLFAIKLQLILKMIF